MSSAMPIFDTLKYANTLKAAGVPDMQAQVQATALAAVLDESTYTRLATKSDIAEVKNEITDIKVGMADLRSDIKLVKWIAVTTAAGVLSQIAKGFL